MQTKEIESLKSELKKCQSGYQDAVISRKELDLCRDELSDELNEKNKLNRNLKALQNENNSLQNQLASKTAENENFKTQLTAKEAENEDLRSRIQRLESDNAELQSQLSRNQHETSNEIQAMTQKN